MFPHERSLVKRLEGKPFALIGVNSDRDREDCKQKSQAERITWRSFWNGGSTSGPISKQYGVTAWPTLYVLDKDGVIRAKNVRGAAADKAINRLLREMGEDVPDGDVSKVEGSNN
jgi:hypothetical protein